MRFLLVGNAPNCDEAVAKAAAKSDVIIQMNDCRYAELLPRVRHEMFENYVFLTNSGDAKPAIVDRLLALKNAPVFGKMQVMLARNPIFYNVKKNTLRAKGNWHWRDYKLNREWERLRGTWPVRPVMLIGTVRLERKLVNLGMPRSKMPSTGMVAYNWIFNRLEVWDELFVEGFTFEGYDRHPWEIEKRLVRAVAPGDKDWLLSHPKVRHLVHSYRAQNLEQF